MLNLVISRSFFEISYHLIQQVASFLKNRAIIPFPFLLILMLPLFLLLLLVYLLIHPEIQLLYVYLTILLVQFIGDVVDFADIHVS